MTKDLVDVRAGLIRGLWLSVVIGVLVAVAAALQLTLAGVGGLAPGRDLPRPTPTPEIALRA